MNSKWCQIVSNNRLLYFFFGKYGFVRHGWSTFLLRLWWRVKNGFWVTDLYGLDESLAKWLSPRMKQIAYMRQGCPCNYGLTPEQVAENEESPDTHEPLWDKWTIDLLSAAEVLDDFLFWLHGGLDHEKGDTKEEKSRRVRYNFEKGLEARKEYSEKLHWIADNIGSMWVQGG